MDLTAVNLTAVLVAAVAGYFLGMLWYSQALFAKPWMQLSGLTADDIKKGMNATTMVIGLVAMLVMAYVLAYIIRVFGATDVAGGLAGGFWTWLGFIATTTINSVLYERKPWRLYVLNNGYLLLALLIMGVILAVWQ